MGIRVEQHNTIGRLYVKAYDLICKHVSHLHLFPLWIDFHLRKNTKLTDSNQSTKRQGDVRILFTNEAVNDNWNEY